MTTPSPAAIQNGSAGVNHETISGSPRSPPASGPNTNPSERAAEKYPNTRARSSGSVRSASADCATRMLPPVSPSTNRETNRSGTLSHTIPSPNRTYDAADPVNATISSGFRP